MATEQTGPQGESESSPLTEFSVFFCFFFPTAGGGTDRPGRFATAQLQDDVLRRHAWSHVLAHEGQARESVSHLPHPHFSTRGLLYRVVEKGGVVSEQLVVPRPYISKVLFMAPIC